MGLLGKGFREFVSDQVKVRQEALGEYASRFSTGDKTKAFLNNTPWIRLASSVNLNESEDDGGVYNQMKNSGLFPNIESFEGRELAKNFVLFGGTTSLTGEDIPVRNPNQVDVRGLEKADTSYSSPYSGLNNSKPTLPFGGAYGFGDWNQIFSENGEGYKPMPGITNMEFSYKNDGALAQATVSIKAFSRAQFQIIDVLFQRPGYTVLLEYGHSVFLDDKGEIQYAGEGDYTFSTDPFQELFNTENNTEGTNHYSLSSKIYDEKKKWNGNYEGAFMKITKFNWKYNKDGSYDITVNLVGIGDIISSLKANIVPIDRVKGLSDKDIKKKKEDKEKGNFLVANSNATQLNQELYRIHLDFNLELGFDFAGLDSEVIKGLKIGDGKIKEFPLPEYNVKEDGTKIIKTFKQPTKTLKIKNGIFFLKNTDNDNDDYDDFLYITFGYLISLITKKINLKDNNGVPQIFFDLNYVEGDNEIELAGGQTYLSTYNGNMSSDPSKILIPFNELDKTVLEGLEEEKKKKYKDLFNSNNENLEILNELKKINKEFFVEDNPSQGRLDRVYLDANYIAKSMDENTIEGECKIIDFLNQILRDINVNLGGINEFRVLFNQDKQLIQFVSEVPTTFEKGKEDNLSVINTMGLESTGDRYKGSFVKEIDLKAELSDNFATQVSIGSQSNGVNSQGNAGSFSLYNKGLIDRIIPNKTTPTTPNSNTNNSGNSSIKPLIESTISDSFLEALKEIYDGYEFKSEYIDIIKQYNSSLSPLVIGKLEEEGEYTTPFFIPFNLGLTLHGLGGIRIYDNFKIDGKMLPLSYNPSQISLIIKSLSHSVSLDGWITKIETLPKPIPQLKPKPKLVIKVIDDIINKILNPTTPTSEEPIPPSNNPLSPTRFDAIRKSFNGVFSQHGEKSGMCSRWSYNLALNYCRALKSNTSIPGRQLAAGGNANQNIQYFRNLVKLGYTQTKVGTNISKNKCISLVKNTQWGYGDVIVYYANDGDSSASHVKYGHTQIYVGSLSTSNWSTSKKNNYGGGFIYKSRNSNKWDFYIFRAPENT